MQFNCFLGRSCRTLQVTFRRRFVDPGLQGRFQLKGIKVCTLEPVTLYVENFFLIVDSLYVASSCIEVGDCRLQYQLLSQKVCSDRHRNWYSSLLLLPDSLSKMFSPFRHLRFESFYGSLLRLFGQFNSYSSMR